MLCMDDPAVAKVVVQIPGGQQAAVIVPEAKHARVKVPPLWIPLLRCSVKVYRT